MSSYPLFVKTCSLIRLMSLNWALFLEQAEIIQSLFGLCLIYSIALVAFFFTLLFFSIVTCRMPFDEQTPEPRRKRVKIVSACGECRRKKTKCNGEIPCRSCEKSRVPCIYPSSSAGDDKKNTPSKAALDAIEERLKTIEDMLRTIIRSQSIYSIEDSTVHGFLHRDSRSSISSATSTPPTLPQNVHTPPPPTSPPNQLNRLPPIHSLSSSHPTEPKLEHRDLPPFGFQKYNHFNNCNHPSGNEGYMKKRKR